MSSSYSANQYDSAFRSQRLQSWCEPKHFKERPTAQVGHTTFIADNRGHLLPGVVKGGSAWSDFKGTWDLLDRNPAHHINPTARSVEGLTRLKSWGFYRQHTDRSQPHRGRKITDGLQDVGDQTSLDVQLDGASEGQSAFQNHPITEAERAASQNQDSQAAVAISADQSVEQTTQATGKDRPLSQWSAAKEKPSLRLADGEGTHSRLDTGKQRPVSNVSEKATGRAALSYSKHKHSKTSECN